MYITDNRDINGWWILEIRSRKRFITMFKRFIQNFGKLKLRYYFGFMNLVFCALVVAYFVSVWMSRPYDWLNFLTRLQTLVILIPNAILFPWIKVYQRNCAVKKGRKNSLTRNILDYGPLAWHAGNEAYNETPTESVTSITKVPLSYSSYSARTSVSTEKKRSARITAIFFCIILMPLFDFCVQYLVWMFSFVLGWFAMNRQLKEWQAEEENQ